MRPVHISGRLVNLGGVPLPDQTVALIATTRGALPWLFTVKTRGDGTFALGANHGEYTLHVDGVWVFPDAPKKIDATTDNRIELGDVVIEEFVEPIVEFAPQRLGRIE